MERPLVTAVTHSTAEARITLTGAARTCPGIAGPRAHRARRREHQRGHDHPERAPVRGPSRRHVVHGPARRPRARAREALEPLKDELGFGEIASGRPRWARSRVVGAGMKSHPGVAAKTFTVLGEAGREHRDDLHLADQDLLRRARGARRDGRRAAAHRVRASAPTPSCPRTSPACTARRWPRPDARRGRGRHRRRRARPCSSVLRERSFPADEVVPFASERSAGRTHRLGRRAAHGRRRSPTSRSRASTSRCSRPARASAPSGRRASPTRAPSWSTTRRSGACTTTCRSSSRRSTPRRSTATTGIVANPNCTTMQTVVALEPILDAAGHRAGRDVELPGGLRHGPEGGRGAARPGAGAAPTRKELPAPAVYPHQIAFNVLPQVETFKDGDDYTTEERKCMRETRKILGRDDIGVSATCARVPVLTGHSESANVQTRDPLSPEECRELLAGAPGADGDRRPGERALPDCRSTPPAATTCWSAGSAATRRTSAASTSGSWATTCARARPPTRCRWPSC